MVKKLSCVSHGSLKRFAHTFTTSKHAIKCLYGLFSQRQYLVVLLVHGSFLGLAR